MQSITSMLDKIKEKNGLKSDYKLALFLGIGEGNLANYRHGRSLPDERACEKIAAALGVDPDLLILQVSATRARSPEIRSTWMRIAQRLQSGAVHVAVLIGLAVVGFTSAPNAEAAALSPAAARSSVCILCKVVRRVWGALGGIVGGLLRGFHVQSAHPAAALPDFA